MEKSLRGRTGSHLLKTVEWLLLGAALVALFLTLARFGEAALKGFPAEDYTYFRESARMLWNGESPYARPKLFYPLYTVFWLFTPLTAGDWTRWIWSLAPIAYLHLVLGRKAILLVPFYPLLVHLRFGQVDGWLILPLSFLLRDYKTLGPVGAALFLFKPQVGWALVLFRVAQWAKNRDWSRLSILAISALVAILPAFVLRPGWVGEWLASVLAHPAEQCQNATIWGWSCFGSAWLLVGGLEGALALLFLWKTREKAASIQLAGMLFTPILYAYDYVLVGATAASWAECAILLGASWVAVAVDLSTGGWGGAYSLVPLVALAMRTEWAHHPAAVWEKARRGAMLRVREKAG